MDLKGIEASGGSVLSIQAGFGEYREVANRILLECGIGRAGPGGVAVIEAADWLKRPKRPM